MKYLDPNNMREGLFSSILKREKVYLYEFPLNKEKFFYEYSGAYENTMIAEFKLWLKNNIKGKFKFLKEYDEIWGISFQKKEEAVLPEKHISIVWAENLLLISGLIPKLVIQTKQKKKCLLYLVASQLLIHQSQHV